MRSTRYDLLTSQHYTKLILGVKMFTASETASIVDGSFSLDFARINLFNENQSVYEGSGSVYIDEEGMLKVKICHVFSKDESAFGNWGKVAQRALSSVPGKVLPTSFYYFLKELTYQVEHGQQTIFYLFRHLLVFHHVRKLLLRHYLQLFVINRKILIMIVS